MTITNVRRTVWTSEGYIYVQDPPVSTYDCADGIYRLITFDANDATPSVANGVIFATANTEATTITDFDDTEGDGHRIMVLINDAYTTIAHDSAKIEMPGDHNRTFNKYEIFEAISLGGVWIARLSAAGVY